MFLPFPGLPLGLSPILAIQRPGGTLETTRNTSAGQDGVLESETRPAAEPRGQETTILRIVIRQLDCACLASRTPPANARAGDSLIT